MPDSINTPHYHYIEWYSWNHNTGTRGELQGAELYDRINAPFETLNLAGMKEMNEVQQNRSNQLAKGWRKDDVE